MRHLLLAALMLVPAQAAQLRVTVYDQVHLSKSIAGSVFLMLGDLLQASGIEIEVVAGDPAADEATLIMAPAAPRPGMERQTACRARRDIALEIVARTPNGRRFTELGMAVPLATEGLNARVFNENVLDAAARQNRDYAMVLAHAIAHEIGHVLMRGRQHSRIGLMSSVWSEREYAWMTRNLMRFSREESGTMRASLTGAGCDPETSAEVLRRETSQMPKR
ncbi:MAG: hypothetical protein ABI806_01010 [Candidatus Solibacter sp.]